MTKPETVEEARRKAVERRGTTGIFKVLDEHDTRRFVIFPLFENPPNIPSLVEACKAQDLTLDVDPGDLQFEYTDVEIHRPPDKK